MMLDTWVSGIVRDFGPTWTRRELMFRLFGLGVRPIDSWCRQSIGCPSFVLRFPREDEADLNTCRLTAKAAQSGN